MTTDSCWISELLGIALATQAIVDSATSTHEDLLERRPEVAVEPGVDDRVKKTVGVAEPQQKAVEAVRDARLRVGAPRFDESQQEERQPARRERSHYDTESLGCLAVRKNQTRIFEPGVHLA